MLKKSTHFSLIQAYFFASLCIIGTFFFFGYAAAAGVTINDGAGSTISRDVLLSIDPPDRAREMRISESSDFRGETWRRVREELSYELTFGSGLKRVHVQFRDLNRRIIGSYDDTIRLSIPKVMTVRATLNDEKRETRTRNILIDLEWSDGVEGVMISNENNFQDIEYAMPQGKVEWILSPGGGEKTVYIRFRDANGNVETLERTIRYVEPVNHIEEGSLLKGRSRTIYYLGFDGRIHPFFHSGVFHSYFKDFTDVAHVSDTKLNEYFIGEPVCMRPGTWLVKFKTEPRVYAPEHDCTLRPIRSEAEAYILYGPRWVQRIVEMDFVYRSFYRVVEVTDEKVKDDRDRDGVDKEVEAEYNTDDRKSDTDGDRLSDYEEIYYWFTDPTLVDTDQDGMMDGQEVLLGRKPNGPGNIEKIPEGTYTYPLGSVVYDWWDTKNYFYMNTNAQMQFLARSAKEASFTSNDIQSRFAIRPPFKMPLDARTTRVSEKDGRLRFPTTVRLGRVAPL